MKNTLCFDINSLGGMSLDDVDFVVKFFAKEKRDSKVTGICTVNKSECTPSEDDANMYFVICDTTNLDTGDLMAELEVEYLDEDTNENIVEKIPMKVDEVKVIESVHLSPKVQVTPDGGTDGVAIANGGTQLFEASVEGVANCKFAWMSSNNNAVTVDSTGLATALSGTGTAYILVFAIDELGAVIASGSVKVNLTTQTV